MPNALAEVQGQILVREETLAAYDWCYNTWSQDQREYVKDVLKRSLDVWPKYSHSQLQVDRGSNWAAVCRGAELVMLLASYEDRARGVDLPHVSSARRGVASGAGPARR